MKLFLNEFFFFLLFIVNVLFEPEGFSLLYEYSYHCSEHLPFPELEHRNQDLLENVILRQVYRYEPSPLFKMLLIMLINCYFIGLFKFHINPMLGLERLLNIRPSLRKDYGSSILGTPESVYYRYSKPCYG